MTRIPAWHAKALCAGRPYEWDVDVQVFDKHVKPADASVWAQKMCDPCPVRRECAAEALEQKSVGVLRAGVIIPIGVRTLPAKKKLEAVTKEGMTVKYSRLNDDVPKPMRAHPTDAGVDLIAYQAMDWDTVKPAELPPGRSILVSTGIKAAIPEGHVGLLVPRSSLWSRHGLMVGNSIGIIDAGYRGEIMVCLHNPGFTPRPIPWGKRIAQILIMPVDLSRWAEVPETELGRSGRGEGGFGSTGEDA